MSFNIINLFKKNQGYSPLFFLYFWSFKIAMPSYSTHLELSKTLFKILIEHSKPELWMFNTMWISTLCCLWLGGKQQLSTVGQAIQRWCSHSPCWWVHRNIVLHM